MKSDLKRKHFKKSKALSELECRVTADRGSIAEKGIDIINIENWKNKALYNKKEPFTEILEFF